MLFFTKAQKFSYRGTFIVSRDMVKYKEAGKRWFYDIFSTGGMIYMKKRITAFILSLVVILGIAVSTPSANAKAVFSIDLEENNTYVDQCGSVYMINTDTGVVIYDKEATKVMYPASTTKIMTALLAIELCPDMDTMVTVDERIDDWLLMTDSSRSGIVANERISMYDLLCCLMLASGNDAALAIASYVGGGDVDYFVALMNERAMLLGCQNTHFVNPHGLHDDNHYTCAYDLTVMAQKAMELPVFAEIVQKNSYKMAATNKNEERYIYNKNYMLNVNYSSTYYYSYCKGIKTGHTSKAGNCFVGYATRNGYNYICTCMGAPIISEKTGIKFNAAFITCKELFDWCFNNLALKEVVNANSTMAEVPLEQAWNKDALTLVPEESFTTLLPSGVTGTAVMKKYDLPDAVVAPVRKGDIVGTVTLSFAGDELGTINLVASESVERSDILYLLSIVNNIVSSTAFLVIAIIAVLAIAAYIIWSLVLGKGGSSKRNRKVRRYR